MKKAFLYRRRKEVSVFIFLLSIVIFPLYFYKTDKELFEKSGEYNSVAVGVIIKNIKTVILFSLSFLLNIPIDLMN